MALMKKQEAIEGRYSIVKFGEMLFEGATENLRGQWKSHGNLQFWGLMETFWIHLGEYFVHAWLDFVTKLQKHTPLAYSWSTSEEYKKLDAVLSIQTGDQLQTG